ERVFAHVVQGVALVAFAGEAVESLVARIGRSAQSGGVLLVVGHDPLASRGATGLDPAVRPCVRLVPTVLRGDASKVGAFADKLRIHLLLMVREGVDYAMVTVGIEC